VAIVKPHQAVTSSTIARWLKQLLQAAGVDISTFTSHSVRGASSSAAAGAGMTVNDILKAADWCSESTLNIFITAHLMIHHMGKQYYHLVDF